MGWSHSVLLVFVDLMFERMLLDALVATNCLTRTGEDFFSTTYDIIYLY